MTDVSVGADTVAVDAHAHVFLTSLPRSGKVRYVPAQDAPLSAYLAHLDRHGLTHGVVVQPSFLGTDNSFLLGTLGEAGGRLRGVAVADANVSTSELEALDAAGVVGLRLNLIGATVPDVAASDWRRVWAFVAERRWHVEVHADAAALANSVGPLLAQNVQVVVDHCGRPNGALGVADPGFRWLLAQATTDRVWVKLSGGYRFAPPGSTLPALAANELVAAFGPRRLVWGSDWPHTTYEHQASYAQAVESLAAWVPDADSRHAILGATAAELFHIDN